MSSDKHIITIVVINRKDGPPVTADVQAAANAGLLRELESKIAQSGIVRRECGEIAPDQPDDLDRVKEIKETAEPMMVPDRQSAEIFVGKRSSTRSVSAADRDGNPQTITETTTESGISIRAASDGLSRILETLKDWQVELGVKIIEGISTIFTRKRSAKRGSRKRPPTK